MTRAHVPSEALQDALELARSTLSALVGAPASDGPAMERRRRLAEAELPSLTLLASMLARTDVQQRRSFLRQFEIGFPPIRIEREILLGLVLRDPPPERLALIVVEYYVRRHPRLTTRAHYNVACFYAVIAASEQAAGLRKRCEDVALAELELALLDATSAAWAQRDPALAPLRESRAEEFAALVARNTPAAHEAKPPAAATAQDEQTEDPDAAELGELVVAFLRELEEQVLRAGRPPEIDVVLDTLRGPILIGDLSGATRPIGAGDVAGFADAVERWERRTGRQAYRAVLLTSTDVDVAAIAAAARSRIELPNV